METLSGRKDTCHHFKGPKLFQSAYVCVFIWECVLMCMCRYMLMLMHVETGGQTQVLFLQRQPATLVLSYLSEGPGLADYARLADQ